MDENELKFKKAKAEALANLAIDTAKAINTLHKELKTRKIKRVKRYDRGRANKIYFFRMQLAFLVRMAIARRYAILSAPIPRFPSAGVESGGKAFIGEQGPEYIRTEHLILPNKPSMSLGSWKADAFKERTPEEVKEVVKRWRETNPAILNILNKITKNNDEGQEKTVEL